MVEFTEAAGAVTFRVHVQPRASRAGLAGIHGDALKLRLVSPPVDGRANAECCLLLARLIGVPPADVEIVAGLGSREKIVRVRGAQLAVIRKALTG